MKYNVGSLFAGVGGICLGFKRASDEFQLVVANEWDKDAATTYEYNFNHSLIKGDIERILNPNIAESEQGFLLKRKLELKKILNLENLENKQNETKKKLQKNQISTLKWSYLLKYMDGQKFVLSETLENKFEKENKIEEERQDFRNKIEYEIILELLKERENDWLEKEVSQLKEKREKLLQNRIDVLTAGFPCQAFSIAGGRKGFSDHRGELFYSVLELVNRLEERGHEKPRVLFLENVKNLVSHDEGRTFKVITGEIEKMGYSVKHHKVFNTYEYTELPQNRERIFIICFRDKEDEINFGSMEDILKLNRNKEQLKQKLASILDYTLTKENNMDLYYTAEKYPNYFQNFGNVEEEKRINLTEQMTEMYEVYQIRRGMYVRKNQSGVCPTLTANMGTGGHNVPLIKMEDGIRKLSPKDCFNLQGFGIGEDFLLPPQLKNAPLYKQAGNAVSVDMVEILAKKILKTLKTTDNIKNDKISDKINIAKKIEEEKNENLFEKFQEETIETKDKIISRLEEEITKLSQIIESYSSFEKNRIGEIAKKLISEITKG